LEGTTRAILVQATYKEMLAGHGPIVIDPSFIPNEKWDDEIQFEYAPKLSAAGIDCRRDRFEWVPALHTFLGGLFINENCETTIPGLFAAGESGTGMHGSNRLSGNAIASCMVLGARAGKQAARFASAHPLENIKDAEMNDEIARVRSFQGDEKFKPYDVESEIKELAWASAGVVRNQRGLEAGVRGFEELRCEKIPKTKGNDQRSWIKALECANLAGVGEMVTRSALARTESRGQHCRDDFPNLAKTLPRWIKLRKNGDRIDCRSEPIPFTDGDLKPEISGLE
jgi:fumarate reductase (CoM/CoB) subunit A